MLLNFISLQISKRCQGQRLPLVKGNLRASSLLCLPDGITHVDQKCSGSSFFFVTKRNIFLLWKLLPRCLPAKMESDVWCVFFPELSMTGPLHSLCSWQIPCSGQIRMGLSDVCVSASFLSDAPAGFQLPYKPASESACFRLQSRPCWNITFKIIRTISIMVL